MRNVAVAASSVTAATADAAVELGVATPGVPLSRGALAAFVLLLGAVAWRLVPRGE